jgi:hypothetical protein
VKCEDEFSSLAHQHSRNMKIFTSAFRVVCLQSVSYKKFVAEVSKTRAKQFLG